MTEKNNSGLTIRCDEMEQLAVLRACAELDAATTAALDAHARACDGCAALLARETQLQQAVRSLEQPADLLDPSGLLLAQCRNQLSESIDDGRGREAQPAWRRMFSVAGWWTTLRGTLIAHPAMSMAVLVVAGFFAGVAGQRMHGTPVAATRPVLTVSATPTLTEQQLQSAASANVAWVTPSGSRVPAVQVQLMAQTPMSIMGSPDDADVRRALTFVLVNSERFDPSVRLDSLEILRTRNADPDVRQALCTVARTDHNPGVRMKALETLQGVERDALVRQTLADALRKDENAGVRVAAMNLLANSVREDAASTREPLVVDPAVVQVLRDRAQHDANNYIRMQSAALLRELGLSE